MKTLLFYLTLDHVPPRYGEIPICKKSILIIVSKWKRGFVQCNMNNSHWLSLHYWSSSVVSSPLIFFPHHMANVGKSVSGLRSNVNSYWWLAFALQQNRQGLNFYFLVWFVSSWIRPSWLTSRYPSREWFQKSKSYQNGKLITLELTPVFFTSMPLQSSSSSEILAHYTL